MDFLNLLNQYEFVVDVVVQSSRTWNGGFYYKVKVLITNKSTFFASEYKDTIERNYSFHWQDEDNKMIIRWDNAPHYPNLATFPHHKHLPNMVEECQEMTLQEALDFIKSVL
jgi:hypothetical protein